MSIAALDLNIAEGTEVPAVTRTRDKAPNPFDGKFPTPEGKTLIVTLPTSTEDEKKVVERVVNAAQEAGRAVRTKEYPDGSTTRTHREETTLGTGKAAKPAVQLTFWSTAKVTRVRKDKSSEQPADKA